MKREKKIKRKNSKEKEKKIMKTKKLKKKTSKKTGNKKMKTEKENESMFEKNDLCYFTLSLDTLVRILLPDMNKDIDWKALTRRWIRNSLDFSFPFDYWCNEEAIGLVSCYTKTDNPIIHDMLADIIMRQIDYYEETAEMKRYEADLMNKYYEDDLMHYYYDDCP